MRLEKRNEPEAADVVAYRAHPALILGNLVDLFPLIDQALDPLQFRAGVRKRLIALAVSQLGLELKH